MSVKKPKNSSIEELIELLGDKLHLTENQIKLSVKASTEGSLALLGKSPTIEFTSISADLCLQDQISGIVHIHPEAIRIVCSHLSEQDKIFIAQEIREKTFEISKHSEIRYEISGISTSFGPDVGLLKGTLFFRGVARRIALPLKLIGKNRLVGNVTLSQNDYGIVPLSSFGGLLRAKDNVDICFEIFLPITQWSQND